MKKYIIGLFSAICLMGAGCTEFEDTLSAENVIHSQCLRSVEKERITINDSGITILMISRVAAYADRFGRSAVYG